MRPASTYQLKYIGLPLLSLLLAGGAAAQTKLGLEEALRLAKQNNTQLQIKDREVALGRAELAGSTSAFLPRVSASYTGLYTNDPLNAFGFKLKHRDVAAADFNPDLLNHPDGISDFNARLSVEQPILNFDAFAARKALKSKLRATEYQKEFATSHIAVEVKTSFERLKFLYEARKAVDQGVAAYEEALRNTRNMQEQGLVKHADVLLVQVGLSNVLHQQIEVENNIANLSGHLSWLMGREGQAVYRPDAPLLLASTMPTDAPLAAERMDLMAMNAGVDAQRGMIGMSRNALLPRVNAFGDYNLNDKDAFGFESDSYLVGVAVTWDIFRGNGTRNKVAQEKINSDKAVLEMQFYVEQQKLQLEKLKRDLAAAKAQLVLAETARDQANESMRIITDRHAEGLERTSDMLAAQAGNLEKQVEYLQAVLEHNLALIQIQFMTNTDN